MQAVLVVGFTRKNRFEASCTTLRVFSLSGGGKASQTTTRWEEHIAVKHSDLPHSLLYSSRISLKSYGSGASFRPSPSNLY